MKQNEIRKQFIKYVTLNIMGMLGFSCYVLADTVFVARGTGTAGLAALNLAIPMYSIINGLGLMIGMGGATRYSVAKGNKDKRRQNFIFTQAFILAAVISVILLLFGVISADSLGRFFGKDVQIQEMTAIYIRTIYCFAPMFIMNNVLVCFIRNDNNPRLSAVAMLAGSFTNIVLDYVFVFPLQMGIFGAALATGVSPLVSMLVLSLHFIRKKNSFSLKKVRMHGKDITAISSIGLSSLIAELSSGIVIMVFNAVVLKISGNIGVAAYGIITNIALVVISMFTGIAQGMQPIISENYGKGNPKNIVKTYRYGMITAVVMAAFLYGIMVFYAKPIISVFNKENSTELLNMTLIGIKIYFAAFFFMGINIVTAAYFGALDRPKEAFLISIMRGVVVVIPAILLCSSLWGLNGAWLSMPVTEGVVFICVICMKRFRKESKNSIG